MTAQTRALCTVRTAPVSHHSTFHLPFVLTEEYWTDPNIDENRPPANPPEFPLQQQVTGSDNLSCDATVAPTGVQPTNKAHQGIRTLSLGAPLHLLLNDAFSNTPTRPLCNVWMITRHEIWCIDD
ncbi:hypothetical protein DAPPUDRAFT_246350 [Daphnia pulex]|uniref:Uncharacterized protein n=1 Tax=Daphnia pulex TaxID=6669 RepID=E9GQ93_DAPPU|nr:hypothetical protein DAPPUDRAFT_246350 [Daphnia pulex]|eukprot:EFX78086.1 hypothetical protein DAPPUDRAFT_246350 [Daphnia pulex]